jgi:acetylornithine deacetylase/succinyl-diaminopimelate desuccinylase-like protein
MSDVAAKPEADHAVETFLAATSAERLESYKALLRIPSISGIPAHAADCRIAAEFAAADLRTAGMEHVEVCETGGHPVVYADWLHARASRRFSSTATTTSSRRTRSICGSRRRSCRWSRTADAGPRLVGLQVPHQHAYPRHRGADADARSSLPVNLRIVFEGEEEASSRPPRRWLAANKTRLAADFAVISDTSFFEGNLPAITVALRGLVYFQLDVTGSRQDLHSGVYGGAVDNPVNALCQIVAALKGPDGRVNVPGFYDDVAELTPLDRKAFAGCRSTRQRTWSRSACRSSHGEPGFTTLERLGARPTLDVCGIWGGFEGEGPKTIIPAHAHAKISCRLVANQDSEKIFGLIADYIARVAPKSVRYSIQRLGDGNPSLTPIDNPATQAAARAIKATFGVTPLYIREGGSVPVCASFESILGLSTVLLGFAPADGQFPRAQRMDVDVQLRNGHPDDRRDTGMRLPRWRRNRYASG